MGRITRLLPVIVVLVLAGSGGHASAAGAPWQAGLFTSVPDSRIRADGELAVLASYGTPDGRAWDVLVQSHCGDVACHATYTIRGWDGAAWSTVGLPATGRQAFDITATGCDDDGHLVLGIDAWNPGGVESDGTIPRNDEVFLVERWDGAGFTELPATAGRLGGDIAVHGPDDIWAVAGTAVVHYDGTRWDTVSLPSGLPPLEPEQIRFAADGDVWAVGERGDAGAPGGDDVTIGLHDGGAWTTLPSPLEGAVPDGLSAGLRTAAPSGDHRLVVGVAFRDGAAPAGGELRAWNGSAWQTISAPTAAAASPQAASSLNDIWATAGSRTFHWNGSTWHAVGIGQTPRLWPGGGIWLPGDVARAAAVDNLGSRGAGYIAPIDVAAPPAGTFAVPLGRAVWLRAARATQVEDGSGFAARTIPAGGLDDVTFDHAGTFALRMPGPLTVAVSPVVRSHARSVLDRITVRWASDDTGGQHADVDIQRPGAGRFVAWRRDVSTSAGSFRPDAGPGTYAFRVRSWTGGGRPSGWSPAAAVTVTDSDMIQPVWQRIGALPDGFHVGGVISDGGAGYWISGTGASPLLHTSSNGDVAVMRFSPSPPDRVLEMAARPHMLALLCDDGVYALRGGAIVRLADRPSTQSLHIALDDRGMPWVLDRPSGAVNRWTDDGWTGVPLDAPGFVLANDPTGGIWISEEYEGRPVVHLTGNQQEVLPRLGFTPASVTAFAANDVLAAAGPLGARWNGMRWIREPWSGNPVPAYGGITGSSHFDAWLSDTRPLAGHASGRRAPQPFVVPWDGRYLTGSPRGGAIAVGCCPSGAPLLEGIRPWWVGRNGLTRSVAWIRPGADALVAVRASETHRHRVRDAAGLGVVDTGRLHPGAAVLISVPSAGTFPLVDTASGSTATIAAPITHAGTVVRLAADTPADGHVIDVQLQAPGEARFRPWLRGVTDPTAQLPSGPGTYLVRARLRDPGTGAHSGWSPVATVTVSG